VCRVIQLTLFALLAILMAGCGGLERAAIESPKARSRPAAVRKPARQSDPSSIAASHALYASAVIHELNGELETALGEFCQAALRDPSDEWLMLEVSRRLIHHRKLEKAAEILSIGAAHPDASGAVLARLAIVYSQLGRTAESQETSRAAIRKAPATLPAYQTLYVNYMQAKQPRQAIEVLEAAAKAPKPDAGFLIGLSELFVSYGTQAPKEKEAVNAEALTLLQRAQKLVGPDPALKMKIADGFTLLGQGDAAAEVYNDLLANPHNLPVLQESVHARLANIYLRSSNKEKAQEQLQALIRADPTNPQPYYFLGHIALDQKKPAEAVECFSKTILLSPDFESAYYELANAQLMMDKPSDALATLEKAREKFAAGFTMEFFSAVASIQTRDFDRAIRHFTAAEVIANATDPKRLNHFFYFQLGVAYEQRKEHEQAAAAFEKSLELSPDFAEAMNYLGYMWADLGKNLDKAAALLEKAVKAEPKNAAFLDSLAWVYFKLNRHQEAFEYITRAVQLSGEPDPVLFDHLGDICHALGRKEEAREAWKKSFKLDPKDAIKSKMERLGEAP